MKTMALKPQKIEFDGFATVEDLKEAVLDLEAKYGRQATVRVEGAIEFNTRGVRVKAITVDRGTDNG